MKTSKDIWEKLSAAYEEKSMANELLESEYLDEVEESNLCLMVNNEASLNFECDSDISENLKSY